MWAKGTIAALHTAFGVKILLASWPVWSLERTKCDDWKSLHWLLGIWGFLASLDMFSFMCLSFLLQQFVPATDSSGHLRLKNKVHSKAFDGALSGWLEQLPAWTRGKMRPDGNVLLHGVHVKEFKKHTKSTSWWACTWTQNLTTYTLAPRTLLWMYFGAAGIINHY